MTKQNKIRAAINEAALKETVRLYNEAATALEEAQEEFQRKLQKISEDSKRIVAEARRVYRADADAGEAALSDATGGGIDDLQDSPEDLLDDMPEPLTEELLLDEIASWFEGEEEE